MANLVVLFVAMYKFASTKKLVKYLIGRNRHPVIQEVNRAMRLKGKCVTAQRNMVFLQKCLDSYVTPSDIMKKVHSTKLKNPWEIQQTFLKDEIEKSQDGLQLTVELSSPLLGCSSSFRLNYRCPVSCCVLFFQ